MNACVLCNKTSFRKLFDHWGGRMMGQCNWCGLVQVVPMPTETEIKGLYHEDFDHFTPYIEQLGVHHAYFNEKVEEIENRKSKIVNRNITSESRVPGSGSRLLDIGCAMGVLLEEATNKGYKAEGIDLSDDAVTYCKRHSLKAHTGTVYTVKQLKENFYDVIAAFQIIEHERDPVRMMRRIHKLLKKGGMVVLATPNYGGFWRKVMGKRWFGFAHPEHVILLDFNSMKKLLETSGFCDIEIRSDSPRPFPLSFAFKRAGDYYPWAAWLLKPIGSLLDLFNIVNPINPWDDMIAFARK